MVTEEAVKVVAEYWDTRIANAVASVFIGSLNNLNILITGDSGVGKTTYAYYGLKVGYIKYLIKDRCLRYGGVYCVEKLVEQDVDDEVKRSPRYLTRDELAAIRRRALKQRLYDALDGLEMGYNIKVSYGSLCFGPDCTKPDGIDKVLRPAMFISGDDIDAMSELLAKVLRGEVKPPKALLLDDALYREQYWDPDYRKLYRLIRRVIIHHRVSIPLMIATAIGRNMVMKDYVTAARNVDAAERFYTVRYSDGTEHRKPFIRYWWWRRIYISRREFSYEDNGPGYNIKVGYTVDDEDLIPKEAAFKMPKWFEEAHLARRRAYLLRSVERYLSERDAEKKAVNEAEGA
ncbi:MAG: hypothetical protein RQ838_05455 [Caldivirga sp.]|nr:hypothetical protein [Caldivirga sp.]